MVLKTEKEVAAIIKNGKAVLKDIDKLTKATYTFLNLSSGFYAHYNLYGFISDYETAENLAKDILQFQDQNQWDNFRPGEKDYEYMMQKKRIYNNIAAEAARLYPQHVVREVSHYQL